MCQAILNEARFYQYLFELDQMIAADIQAAGCPHCGDRLHVGDYPRKPRGPRSVLDETYQRRLSFCCAGEDCRRRITPPSVRFLGRKVYLGVIVVLVTALTHGLSLQRRSTLIEQLDLWPQTIARWQRWWRDTFPGTRCWQGLRGRWVPALDLSQLPGALLGRLNGANLAVRLGQLLGLLAPLTTTSWSGSLKVVIDPQKM